MRIVHASVLSAAAFFLVGTPGLAVAQRRGRVVNDSATTVSITYPQLFGNIQLTPDQEAKAKVLIWRTQSAQLVAAREPNGYAKIVQLQVVRDSALSTLLTNDADRAKFEANAAKVRPHPLKSPRD
jgi:hypothetical protein